MAAKIDEWFDELSEDWVSQPRGSSPRSSAHGNSSRLSRKGSHSRIPIPKSPSSNSPSSLHRPGLAKSRSTGNTSTTLPLKDSTSKLNVSRNRPFPTDPRNRLRRTSTESALSAQYGTVQYNQRQISASMDENYKGTPEWKRRVLHGELKPGERKDLFSPIGLENVFQAPSTRNSPLRRPVKNSNHLALPSMPLSPPLPGATRNQSQKRQKFRSNSENSANEESELSLFNGKARHSVEDDGAPENSVSLPSMIPDRSQSSEQQDTNEPSEIVMQPLHAVVDAIGPSTDLSEPKCRVFSNKSELRNEGISIVSLPALRFRTGTRTPGNTPERSLLSSHQPTSEPPHNRHSLLAYGRGKSISYDQDPFPAPPFADLTSQSLPDDLSMGTQEFNARGGFVNLRRGGNSVENSFLKKTLNPSILQANDPSASNSSSPPVICHRATQSEPSTQIGQEICCKGSGSLQSSPPKTPPRNLQQQAFSSPERPRSSGSPLKLFDKYDTFTNDRLIRRLSKFEESFDDGSNGNDEQSHTKTPQRQERSNLEPLPESPHVEPQDPVHQSNNFGDGDLNQFEFSHQGSDDANWPAPNDQAGCDEDTEKRPKLRRVSSSSTGVRRPSLIGTRVRSHEANPDIDDCNSSKNWFGLAKQQEIRKVNVEWKEGKRLPNSPRKSSQAKRRRISYVEEDDAVNAKHKSRPSLTNSTHSTMSVIGKRKDARYDSNSQFADEQVLASRRILRPRAPTPGQMKYGSHQKRDERSPSPPERSSLAKDLVERVKGLSLQHPPTSPTEALAADLATFALDVAHDITSGARKASLTTGDFFVQAKAIMEHIRSKNRSPSALEEDTTLKKQTLDHIEERSYEDSTVDRFSRPPSREGLSLRRLRGPPEVDPRIASHLRKFEDHDGVVDGLQLPNEDTPTKKVEQTQEMSVVSDPPNIRIFSHAERNLPESSHKERNEDVSSSMGSKSSQTLPDSRDSANSANQSSSASGTRSKEFIAPEKVAHFLPKEVAGMTYDQSRKAWVKKRSSEPRLSGSDRSGDITENDPFEDIPDLSTDELEEQARLKRIAAMALQERNSSKQRQSLETGLPPPSSPPYQAAAAEQLEMESSAMSHRSTVETGAARTETRATSLDQEDADTKRHQDREVEQQLTPEKEVIEIEHEISILESRASETPIRPMQYQQPRVFTVSFSSPIADSREPSYHDLDRYDGYEVDSDLDLASSPEKPTSSKPRPSLLARRGRHRKGRRQPLVQASYSTRQISRIDEQEEMSFHENLHLDHEVSFSVVLHTPRQPDPPREGAKSIVKLPSSSAMQLDASFQLTPLPDFTFNQSDELQPHNASRPSKNKGLLCARDVKNRFSFAIKDLVQKITDIEPFEPYWDYLRRLDLGNRNLESLHMLDEFCGRIEELDVSNNALTQVHGVPQSLRVLSAQGNALSNLTAWGHLQNLQYLDISGNSVSSLANLQGLYHLRELRANDNAIESITCLAGLNGLLRLRLRRNAIEAVDLRDLHL